jgi:hypothetical protein
MATNVLGEAVLNSPAAQLTNLMVQTIRDLGAHMDVSACYSMI